MTMKGMKHTAESKARISAGQKRAWAKLKADAEQKAIDCAVPRCRNDLPVSMIYRGKVYPNKAMMMADASANMQSYVDVMHNIGKYRPAKKTFWQHLIALVMGGK